MHILFFRHGIAEESSRDGSDASRRLTAEGRRKALRAVRGLAKVAPPPEVIFSSPKVRAVQTAELAAEVFDRPVRIMAELGGQTAEQMLAALGQIRAACVMAVGHEPQLSTAVSVLCGGRESFVQLGKAGCACVEVHGPGHPLVGPGAEVPGARVPGARGMLRWLATPSMLRSLR
jgi:phosphohistidine phosphatase